MTETVNKRKEISITAWNPSRCYGCMTCVLACSFHNTGAFWPERSNIAMHKSARTGVIEWSRRASCEGCEQEPVPLCVRYCIYGALALRKGRASKEGSLA